jgi:benzylsuccinate CoA-transferase BbsF subunit
MHETAATGQPATAPATPTAAAPLAGVRVVDFTQVVAGPYATLQLAYFGAEVIRVESRARGDPWRFRDGNRDPDGSVPFADQSKGKRSVTLNLKTPEGIALVKRLVALSDVVIENFSVGVMDRLGLGYAALRAVRPGLIQVSMPGLGNSGPQKNDVTFGPTLMALCGLTYLWNHADLPEPVGSQTSYPDYVAGLHAAFAILAALHYHEATGQGQFIDLAQAEVTATLLGPAIAEALNNGREALPRGNTSPSAAPHGCYRCAGDDAWVAIAVETDAQWAALADVLGRPAWTAEARLAAALGRVAAREEIDAQLSAWTRERDARAVMEQLQAAGVPAGIVAGGEELYADPQLRAREFLVRYDHPLLGALELPDAPVRFRHARPHTARHGPLLGADNAYVLGELLGLSEDERQALAARQVVH